MPIAGQEIAAGQEVTIFFPLPWATESADEFRICIDEMGEQLKPTPQALLSLSVSVDNRAETTDNAARSRREGQILLVNGPLRTGS